MQLKLGIQDSTPSPTKNLAVQYSLVALCNKCGATHDMAVSVRLDDGPIEKQSIGHVYSGKVSRISQAVASAVLRQEGNRFRKISTKYF